MRSDIHDRLRVMHVAPRLSNRGGADLHMLSMISHLGKDAEQLLAVGKDDGTAQAQAIVEIEPLLSRRQSEGCEALQRRVEAWSPDIVHLHNVMNPAVLEAAEAWPALLTIQDHRVFCPGQGKLTGGGERCDAPMDPTRCAGCFEDERYFEKIYQLTKRRLDAARRLPITVLSRYMERELVAMGCDGSALWVNPPFVFDLGEGTQDGDASARGDHPHPPSDGRPYVLFVGRLVRAKGVFDAEAAWRSSGVDLPLVFAGTGSCRGDLEARGHGVLGWRGRHDLAQIYRHAAVLVLPSRWQEPFGIVGLEALHYGLPVAAWESGGVKEWHPGGVGLTPWGDTDALGAAIKELAGTSAARSVFDASSSIKQLRDIYRRVMGTG